jgi:hypothetical protein
MNHLCPSSSLCPCLHYNAESLWSMYGILLMGEARKIQTVCWKVGQKGAVYHVISDVITSIVIILYQLLRKKNDDKGRSFPLRTPVIVRGLGWGASKFLQQWLWELFACNQTNVMHYLSLVYWVTSPLHVSGLLVALHQEVAMYILYVTTTYNTYQLSH